MKSGFGKNDEVWCLVEVINRLIVDLADKTLLYEDKGVFRDYSYNDKTKRLTREINVAYHERVKTYRFNITDSNIFVPIAKLTEVNCEE